MSSYKRLMVGLDFTMIDKTLIRYTGFLSYYLRPEVIYFVNIQESLDVPEEIKEKYQLKDEPRDEKLREDIMREVREFFPDHKDYNIETVIVEGVPRREILKWTHIKEIDLLIMGQKKSSGGGIVPKQLARKVQCSVLFVPEKTPMQLRRVLVANDFSEYAQAALEAAIGLARTDNDIQIFSNHIFVVPYGYYRTGKTEDQFAKIMEAHAKDWYTEFIHKVNTHGIQIEPIFTLDRHKKSPAHMVNEVAEENQMDMIVLGARGRNAFTALLLGSVAEKLIQKDQNIPLLLVKKKDKSFDFFKLIDSL